MGGTCVDYGLLVRTTGLEEWISDGPVAGKGRTLYFDSSVIILKLPAEEAAALEW